MLTSESNYLDIDLDYLERIVFKTCLEDEIYLNSIIDNLNYKFFKNKNFQQIIKIIQALYKKNKKRPSRTELELYLNRYLKMMAKPRRENARELQGQYDKHLAGTDPALGILKSYYDKEFAEKYIHEFLFDLAKK